MRKSGQLQWYQWPLIPLALPAMLVVAIPLGVLALFAMPYYKIFPDHHPHIADRCGNERQRQLLAGWRSKYRKLGLIRRIGVALGEKRRRHPVYVREIKQLSPHSGAQNL